MNRFRIFSFLFIFIVLGCNPKSNFIVTSPTDSVSVSYTDSVEGGVKPSKLPKKYKVKNCYCEEYPELNDYISCDTTTFSNGAKIYRQFTCDSSWLVFENKKLKKNIYSLEKDMIEYTHKLGYVEWDEYKNSILFENKVVSGCCQPYEYDLIDKEDGSLIKKLGRDIFIGVNNLNPIFASLDTLKPKINFYNMNARKSASFDFDFKKIDTTIKSGFMMYPEELFEEGAIENGVFRIKYRYKLKKKDDWKFEVIIFDLNKLDFK